MSGIIAEFPLPGDTIAVIRCQDDLIEAFRKIKDILGLSNKVCDDLIGLADGHVDKVLGPTRAKGLSGFMFDNFAELFAVEFEMKINLDAAKRMESRWEQRETKRIHPPHRVSKQMVERAKPHVLKDFATIGGKASGAKRTGSQGSEIMRKVAKRGWRKRRRAMREQLLKTSELAQPAKLAMKIVTEEA